MLMNSRSLK